MRLAAGTAVRLVACGTLVLGQPGLAQTAASGTAKTNNQPGEIEEIIVTAQKRAERLQDVPISVATVGGDKLQQMAIQNFESVQVPGVTVARGGMADSLTIRGIGSGQNLGFEQSAPIYIDGIYYGRARMQRLAFLDLERIELLKGPQPTYLGKNAIAGAVNISTRAPSKDFAAQTTGSYEFETKEKVVDSALSGPIADRVYARAALKYRDSEGYLTNTATGRKEPKSKDLLGRLVLLAEPTDDFSAKLTLYAGRNTDHGRNNQSILCQPQYRANISAVSDDACTLDRLKNSFSDLPSSADQSLFFDDNGGPFFNRLTARGANLKLDYHFKNGLSLTSLTGYYSFTNKQFIDTDQGIANLGSTDIVEDYAQWSQEFRLLSPKQERFNWFAGAYFDHNYNKQLSQSTTDNNGAIAGSTLLTAANRARSFTQITNFNERANSWAVFGEGSYNIAEKLNARIGLRYEEVDKFNIFNFCNTVTLYTTGCATLPTTVVNKRQKVKNSRLQPSATLEYRPDTRVMLYGSVKQGFKSGGFSGTDAGIFQPEKVTSYEIGAKTTLFDRRVTLNVAAFLADYKDLQVSAFDPFTNLFATGNAASSRSQGVEAEAQWAITPELRLAADASYLNAKYSSFPAAQCFALQTLAQGCGVRVAGAQDLAGGRLAYAPEWSGDVSLTWTHPISERMRITAGADAFASSRFFTLGDNNPLSVQKGYAKVNARLALGSNDGRWEMAFVARNLTNQLTAGFRNTIPQGGGSVGAFTDLPATYTVQLRLAY